MVALAEIGDKTQLLAFLLARFKTAAIILDIWLPLVNLAGWPVRWARGSSCHQPEVLRWVLGLSLSAGQSGR